MERGQRIRIATRGSKLARWQADWVAARLGEFGANAEIIEIQSSGDAEQLSPVAALGSVGVFTKEIQAAALDGRAELAVHSLKDLPTEQTPGLTLAAIPPREDPSDALVARGGATLDALPDGARIGTGSVRRRAQLLHLRPGLAPPDIRGNVDTRLRKLDAGEFDAIVLAAAGLARLGWSERITEFLAPPRMLPAPGQGALALECGASDSATRQLVAKLDHMPTRLAVTAERMTLAELRGGCSAPVGAWGRIVDGRLCVEALVADGQGKTVLRVGGDCELSRGAAEELGRSLALQLTALGAGKLIAATRP